MRIFGTFGRTPVSGFLQVEYFIGGKITSVSFFAVCISYFPMLAAERFAILIQQIKLGDGSVVFSILGVESFQAEMTGMYRSIEFYLLPTVSSL